MTTEQLIAYLRSNVNIQAAGVTDSAYLSMSDEDLLLYLNVALTRDFSEVPSLDYLPASNVYPLMLIAKKELYYALAVVAAPDYDIGADNNNYLKRDERFSHYMKLIGQVDKEYEDYLDDGAGGTLTSFDVLLSNRYYTKEYYEKGVSPAPILYVDSTTSVTANLHWKNNVNRFAWVNVYCSTKDVVDMYQDGNNKIVSGSTVLKHIVDARQTTIRLEGLTPSTTYHAAIEVVDLSALIGYAQVTFTTPSSA